jgi:hypothetical protein
MNENFPRGCYMNLEELKSRNPSIHCPLQVKGRDDDTDKVWIWAEDFRLVSKNKCLTKTQINNEVWAYSNDTFLYLNCKAVKLQSGYTRVLTNGRFLAFYENWVSLAMGLPGGFIVGAIVAGTVTKPTGRYLQVIDLKTSMRYLVDSSYIEKTLKDFPALHEKFSKEGRPNDSDVHIGYLQEVNEAQ